MALQCKRVRSFGPQDALKEVEKVLALSEAERPADLVFLVTCKVSANTRQQVRERCAGEMQCNFWAGTELDEKVKRYADILEEFFNAILSGQQRRGCYAEYGHILKFAIYLLIPLVVGSILILSKDDLLVHPTPTVVAILRTDTPTPTYMFTATSYPVYTPYPTYAPLPTDTPVPPTLTPMSTDMPTPAPPTTTPLPLPTATPIPAPSVDFKVITQRMFSMEENGDNPREGSCGMNHTLYIRVVDINGVPLDGIVVGIDDPAGRRIELTTGEKGPGKAEFPMYGTYVVRVLRVGDRGYISEITRWLDSKQPTIDDLWNGGYCLDRSWEECNELRELGEGYLCYGHYSYEVVFQRQW